jgi:hypothetical protein
MMDGKHPPLRTWFIAAHLVATHSITYGLEFSLADSRESNDVLIANDNG